MKKILIIIILIQLSIGVYLLSKPCDKFNEKDLNTLISYFKGNKELTDKQKSLYDMNGDGKISSIDYSRIKFIIEKEKCK